MCGHREYSDSSKSDASNQATATTPAVPAATAPPPPPPPTAPPLPPSPAGADDSVKLLDKQPSSLYSTPLQPKSRDQGLSIWDLKSGNWK